MKVKNISGGDLIVPWLGDRLVDAGQSVEVPAADVTAYTQQESTWEPADDEARAAHDAMLTGIAELTAARELVTEAVADPDAVEDAPARELIKAVGVLDDPDEVATLLAAEEAGQRRVTVLRACHTRLAQLRPPTPDSPDSSSPSVTDPAGDGTPED